MPFARFDENGKIIRNKVGIDCQKAIKNGETIRTEQAHAKEVNINNIIKKHGVDLIQKTANMQALVFDDVSGNDFQEAMLLITRGQQQFDSMPSAIRAQFDNSPAKFMDFVQNPENASALVDMGLANPPPVAPAPVQVEVVNEPVAETPAT